MKRYLILILFFYFLSGLKSQTSNDTANTPYYLDMMQNRKVNFYQTVRAFNLYWQGRDSSVKGCGWKPFKRWEWEMRQIIQPDGSYPDMQQWINQYYAAANSGSAGGSNQQGGIGGPGLGPCKTKGDWKELGPGFLPYNRTSQPGGVGRLNAVAFHPTDSNILWVCAPAGGLWKSTNGGNTWTTNTDSLPTLGTSALVISPRNTDTMYLGTGDRDHGDAAGLGVYMTANGGKTWTVRNSGMGNQTVCRLLIHPSNTKILLAATTGGVYRTTNSGGTWTQILSGNYKDIVFNPSNPNTVFATRDGLFFRSTNCGLTFTQITSGLPTSSIYRGAIGVTAADTSYVYFFICDFTKYYGTYRSVNGGTTFSTRSTTPNVMDYSTNGSGTGGQAWYDLDFVCDPTNRDIVFAGGVNIFKSIDGASTWTISGHWIGSSTIPSVHADQHHLEYSPVSKRLYVANDGGIYYSINNGVKWRDLSNGIGVSQIYKLGKSALIKDQMIAGFQDNGTSYFGNSEWSGIRGGDGMDCAWDAQDDNYSYGALYYGNITRFYKGSHDITIANNGTGGINETGDWVTPYCLREDNNNTMFIGYKNIWRNTNVRGTTMTWTNISNNGNGNNIRCVENSPAKSDILYYSRYDNKFFRSYKANSTASWVDLTGNLPSAGTPSAIACHPTDSNTVYIGLNGRVYRSRNRGINWTDLSSGLPLNTVNSIALDTSNSKLGIYVGTYTGVWFKDSTTTFTSFSNGLPINGNVTDLEIFYDKGHKSYHRLYAATFSRGTWKTSLWDDGSKKPKTEFSVKFPRVCNDKTYKFVPECGYNPTRFKWLITPKTFTYTNGTDSLSEFLNVKFNKPGYYTVRLATENCNGSDTLTKINYVVTFDSIAVAANCKTTTSTLSDNYGIGITNVELNGLANPSSGAFDEGSNVDFSCKRVFFLKPAGRYFTKITTGPYYSEYVKVYMDFNDNGKFTDAGEEVFSTYNQTNHGDTIRCPNTMIKNKILRMRVVSDYNSIGGSCANLSYGQSEDYGVYFDEPSPSFSVSSDSTCVNSLVTITNTTKGFGYNYTWNFGSNATPATGTGEGPFQVKYSSQGYKKISVTINGSLTKSKDSAVKVLRIPDVTIFVKKGKLIQCEKDSFVLAARDVTGISKTYQWQKTNADIGSAIDSLLSVFNHTIAASGSYRVIASNSICKDTSSQVSIVINPKPIAGFKVNNNSQCLKGNKFVVTDTTKISSGTYTTLYTYSNGGSDTARNTSKIFATEGTYAIRLKTVSNFGCSDSVAGSVTVYPQVKTGFNINDTDQCKNGNNFTFTNTSTIVTGGTFTTNWQYGNGNTGATTNGSQAYATNGSYSVKLLTNSNFNCKDTLTKKVIVFASPIAGFTINDSTQCQRDNKFIYTNGSSIANGTMNYQWSFGDNSSSTSINTTKTYAAPNTYSIKLKSISNNNCTDSVTKKVFVYDMPSSRIVVNDSSQCQPINIFKYNSGATIGSGLLTLQWNFGDGQTSGLINPQHFYASTGNYTARLIAISPFTCADTAYRTMEVFGKPTASFTMSPTLQCFKGNAITINNTSTSPKPYKSVFDFGNLATDTTNSINYHYASAGVYKVVLKVTIEPGCEDTTSKMVKIIASPVADYAIVNNNSCSKNNLIRFTNQSTPATGLSYDWQYGDNSSSANQQDAHHYSTTGNFIVRLIATNSDNCKDTISKTVTVLESPIAQFGIDKIEQCINTNLYNFTNTSILNSGTLTHDWRFGDANTSTDLSPSHKYSQSGILTVQLIIKSNSGCNDTVSKSVQVLPQPTALFNIKSIDPETREFEAVNPFYSSYEWLISNTIQGNGKTYKHFFLINGEYNTRLIVTDSNDCKDTSLVNFKLNSPALRKIDNNNNAYIYPNPTPNTAEIKFELSDTGFVKYSVYDNTGKQIYFFEKENLPKGVYVYYFDFIKAGLSQGTYYFVLETNKGITSETIIYNR
ncbi:MAG: PKD domain-containing protein [Bacteroidota bacterium]